MRASLVAAALTLVVAFAACGAAPSGLSDADKAAIRSAGQKYVETLNTQNIDGWHQLVSDNAVYMPLNHAPIEGREAVEEWQKATMKSLGPTKLEGTPAEIEGRGDVAFVRGAYATTLNGANTGTGNYSRNRQHRRR
jgi:ketosteroid isomerase-like protein